MKLTGRTSGTVFFWGPPKVNPSGRERESDVDVISLLHMSHYYF